MLKKKITHKEESIANERPSEKGAFKKVITSTLLWALLLTGCNKNIANDEMILNKEKQSITFVVEYKPKWDKVLYYVNVSKDGNKYIWTIDKRIWPNSQKISYKYDDLNSVFNKISSELDDYQMLSSTLDAKDKKLEFAKRTYNDIMSNSKDIQETWDIVIKYKPE